MSTDVMQLRLDDLGQKLDCVLDELRALKEGQVVRDWYTTAQFAQVEKLAEFTVREHCRLGRIQAEKRGSGRGAHLGWSISHDELRRYRRFGLRPLQRS